MRVAIVCASRYGATAGIADRIADSLSLAGHLVRVYDAHEPPHAEAVAGFDAFVVGSAVYLGRWLKDAQAFVRRYQPTLLEHPVWLFSSGPLGSAATPADATRILSSAVPAQIAEFSPGVRQVGHRVFFGAIDPESLSVPHRLIRGLPGGSERLPAGDFRDWPEIDAWADDIVRHLATAPRGR